MPPVHFKSIVCLKFPCLTTLGRKSTQCSDPYKRQTRCQDLKYYLKYTTPCWRAASFLVSNSLHSSAAFLFEPVARLVPDTLGIARQAKTQHKQGHQPCKETKHGWERPKAWPEKWCFLLLNGGGQLPVEPCWAQKMYCHWGSESDLSCCLPQQLNNHLKWLTFICAEFAKSRSGPP